MLEQRERDKTVIALILRYCEQIDSFLERFERSCEVFEADHLFRNAVSMAELQIGELSGHLSDEFRENNTEIP